jgi:hypothetical protein
LGLFQYYCIPSAALSFSLGGYVYYVQRAIEAYSIALLLLYLRLLEIWLMLHELFAFGALFNQEYSNRKQAFAYQERQG